MLTCVVQAQTQSPTKVTAVVKGALPDGSYIVAIDGADYKALPAATVREVLRTNEELAKCQSIRAVNDKQIETYEATLGLLKRDRDLADKEAQLERERGLRFSAMYTLEHDLRLKSEQVNARSGTSNFFDRPLVQIWWKAAMPAFQSYLASRRH